MRKAPKLPICDHYEIYNGYPVAVIYRANTNDRTEPCPFCGEKHRHGYPDGHRNTHCEDNITYKRGRYCLEPVKLTPDEIVASDGTILKREDGYIVRTSPNTAIQNDLVSLAMSVVQILDQPSKKAKTTDISVKQLIVKAKRILQTHNL